MIKETRIDTVNLDEILIKFWKNKFFIISLSFIGLLVGSLMHSLFVEKKFETLIVLNNPPIYLFQIYNIEKEPIFNSEEGSKSKVGYNINNPYVNFLKIFESQILSQDNLFAFLDAHKYDDKIFLKNKNKTNYPNSRIQKKNNLNLSSEIYATYVLKYQAELNGPYVLNKYIKFINNKVTNKFKLELESSLKNNLTNLEDRLLDLKIVNSTLSDTRLNTIKVEENISFLKERKLIMNKINYLKKLISNLKKDNFEYDIILDKAKKGTMQSISIAVYAILGFLFFFFLSIFFLIFKSVLKIK